MSLAAFIPVPDMEAANAALESAGFGPLCFSVPTYGGAVVTHAALHTWGNPAFEAAIKALPNVTWSDIAGTPAERVADALPPGAQWAGNIQPLEGQVE